MLMGAICLHQSVVMFLEHPAIRPQRPGATGSPLESSRQLLLNWRLGWKPQEELRACGWPEVAIPRLREERPRTAPPGASECRHVAPQDGRDRKLRNLVDSATPEKGEQLFA